MKNNSPPVSIELDWILLDLDNTLLDFDQGASIALRQTFEYFQFSNHDILVSSYLQINHYCWSAFERGEMDIPTIKRKRFELFVQENQLEVLPGLVNSYYLDLLSRQITEIEGARHMLEIACQKCKLALVTNGFAEVQRPRLHRSGLEQYFECVIISEEIGNNKPEKAFFDYTFSVMGQPDPARVMIIGDSLSSDIKGGLDYGMLTCWFNPGRQQGSDLLTPHFTIDSLHQIHHLWAEK